MLENQSAATTDLRGKPFPCPLCGMALPVGISQKQKPYCVCNLCGIQIFFRGKLGIKRLQSLLKNKEPISEEIPSANVAVSLYNRLEQLRAEKAALEEKQGIIFRDQTLDDTIAALDGEIEELQSAIRKTRKNAERIR